MQFLAQEKDTAARYEMRLKRSDDASSAMNLAAEMASVAITSILLRPHLAPKVGLSLCAKTYGRSSGTDGVLGRLVASVSANGRLALRQNQIRQSNGNASLPPGKTIAPWIATIDPMADVTRILSQIEQGDPDAAEQLLPLVYDELRKLAAAKMAQEKPGQTLQATALVHEAYLRLVAGKSDNSWDGRGHFFAAAAEAMRRVLVEKARQKKTQKAGGGWQRSNLDQVHFAENSEVDLLAINDALDLLESQDSRKAAVVKLRYFVGLTVCETADALGVSTATADNDWAYAKSWLKLRLDEQAANDLKTPSN